MLIIHDEQPNENNLYASGSHNIDFQIAFICQ